MWRQGSPAAAAKAPWSMDGSRKEQQDKKMPACGELHRAQLLDLHLLCGSNLNISLSLSLLCVYVCSSKRLQGGKVCSYKEGNQGNS